MWMKALYLSAIPSRFSAGIALLASGGLWATVSILLAFTFADEDEIDLVGAFVVIGLMLLPSAAAAIGLGGLFNRKWSARLVQLVASTALFLAGWLFLSVGYAAESGVGEGFAVGSLFLVLPIGFSGLLATIHVAPAYWEVRKTLQTLHTEWLTHGLDLRGYLDADEIRQHTGWDLERAEACADEAGFEATLEGTRLRLDRVAQRQRERILAMVQTRGELHLAELAQEFQEPADALRHRIEELQASGDFHGYLDRETLYSSDLLKLRRLPGCPACSGPLDLAGQGMIRCPGCDTVVYL